MIFATDLALPEAPLPLPDGMAFAEDGRLFVALFGQGDVTVFDRDGTVVERIQLLGRGPTNLAFGPAGEQRIYAVENEHGRIESYDAGADGAPLYG